MGPHHYPLLLGLTDAIPQTVRRNGKEWYRLRKISQQALLNPNNVNAYIAVTEEVTIELIDLIRSERDSQQEMPDFEYDLYKWSLESEYPMHTQWICGLLLLLLMHSFPALTTRNSRSG